MDDENSVKLGRPRILTDSAKKEKNKLRCKGRYSGNKSVRLNQKELVLRWQITKERVGIQTDAAFAKYLLDL